MDTQVVSGAVSEDGNKPEAVPMEAALDIGKVGAERNECTGVDSEDMSAEEALAESNRLRESTLMTILCIQTGIGTLVRSLGEALGELEAPQDDARRLLGLDCQAALTALGERLGGIVSIEEVRALRKGMPADPTKEQRAKAQGDLRQAQEELAELLGVNISEDAIAAKLHQVRELRRLAGVDQLKELDWRDPLTWPISMQRRRQKWLTKERVPEDGWGSQEPCDIKVDVLIALAYDDSDVQEVYTYLEAMIYELMDRLPRGTLEGKLAGEADGLPFALLTYMADVALRWTAKVQALMPYETVGELYRALTGKPAPPAEDSDEADDEAEHEHDGAAAA